MDQIEAIVDALWHAYRFDARLTPRGNHLVVVIDGEDALRIPVASLDAPIEHIVIEIGNLASWRAREFGMMH